MVIFKKFLVFNVIHWDVLISKKYNEWELKTYQKSFIT